MSRTPALRLREQQQWFARAIMDSGHDVGAEVDSRLTAGPRSAPRDRLDIYRAAYVARLVECLADDYPALRDGLGPSAFEALARAYVERYPSTSPNLNFFGRRMPELLAEQGAGAIGDGAPAIGFLRDLAALEWAVVEAIHAPAGSPLTTAGLASIPAERWADVRLVPTPSLRVLSTSYPVARYYQEYREGGAPDVPPAEASAVAVYRNRAVIWRMPLSPPMRVLLESLAAGDPLGTAIERAAGAFGDVTEDVAGARLTAWFGEWVASGMFARAEIDPSERV